jgi:lactoylglutathione lyase
LGPSRGPGSSTGFLRSHHRLREADGRTDRRWCAVDRRAPATAATTIALVRATDKNPAGVETGIRFVTPDADADHADLLARGVAADDVLRWPGVPAMFAFRDPDGNGYEIVEGA